jgi:hypothetical protein
MVTNGRDFPVPNQPRSGDRQQLSSLSRHQLRSTIQQVTEMQIRLGNQRLERLLTTAEVPVQGLARIGEHATVLALTQVRE